MRRPCVLPKRSVMTETPALLAGRNLTKIYTDGEVHAVRGVSLEIRERESVAITGPSGSGKTTLLHLLGGLDRPTQGEILFRGRPLTDINPDLFRSQSVGFIFQNFFLIPTLNASENVQIPMFETSRSRLERAERAHELLREVGLEHRARHKPSRLSIGERQRVAIARSLANDPELLLADEPNRKSRYPHASRRAQLVAKNPN